MNPAPPKCICCAATKGDRVSLTMPLAAVSVFGLAKTVEMLCEEHRRQYGDYMEIAAAEVAKKPLPTLSYTMPAPKGQPN